MPGPVFVEDGADVDAQEEGQEGIQREDPADRALTVARKLVRRHPRLQRGHGVHQAQRRDERHPAAEDDGPRSQPALRVRLLGLGCGGARLWP